MVTLETHRSLDPFEIDEVADLCRRVTAFDGRDALGEHQWLDLVQGGRAGFAGIIAKEEGHDHPVAYAQVSRSSTDDQEWTLELVVSPHHREDEQVAVAVIEAALDVVAAEGGGHIHWWVSEPRPDHERIAAATSFAGGRDLYQMRRPLPAPHPFELTTRPFVTGLDEKAWLEVNNAAFAWHPEQGGWTHETIADREKADWFDPAGFLMYEVAGRLAGFCWTRVHPAKDGQPALGEIYVVAVAPHAQGSGLGRSLTLAGLDRLHRINDCPIGMLYVDASNVAAVRLYATLGFTIHHLDRAFVTDVTPA